MSNTQLAIFERAKPILETKPEYNEMAVQPGELSGRLAEVEGLLSRGVEPSAPAFQAIGYRQLVMLRCCAITPPT